MLFGTIGRAATDCCTFFGSICKNSAQFGALRRITALSQDQSVTIRGISARRDRLLSGSGIGSGSGSGIGSGSGSGRGIGSGIGSGIGFGIGSGN